ncbi:hypothetical protein CR513_13882, partial [Mucuna pruriens]
MNPGRKDWSRLLEDALWEHRTAYRTLLGMSPYQIVFGKTYHLLVELKHKAFWAVKQCNLAYDHAEEQRKFQLQDKALPSPYRTMSTTLSIGLDSLLEVFKDMFLKVPHKLPPFRGIEHHINLTLGATLPNRSAYRTNPKESKEIKKKEHGPLCHARYSCAKNDGTWRMFIDCRPINNITIRYRHITPCLVYGFNLFSKIYLRSGYHQIRIEVRSMLEILRKNIFVNLDKCIFCTHEVVFLSLVIVSHRVKIDKEKILAKEKSKLILQDKTGVPNEVIPIKIEYESSKPKLKASQ